MTQVSVDDFLMFLVKTFSVQFWDIIYFHFAFVLNLFSTLKFLRVQN